MTATKPEPVLVIGTSPFALFLAGLLAADHSRSVILVRPSASTPRHHAGMALSAALQTRPESWAVMRESASEAARRLNRLANGSVRRADPIFAAQSPAAILALHHMRHLAHGFGHAVEPLTNAPDNATKAFRLRDTLMADETALTAPLLDWVTALDVQRVADTEIMVRRDGTAQFGEQTFSTTVYAGDDAAHPHLLGTNLVQTIPMRHYLTEPVQGFGSAPILRPDLGVTLVPRADGALEITAEDTDGLAEARIASALPEGLTLRRAAEISYTSLRAGDGAALIGPLRRGGPIVLAGLASQALFLAPTLARMIAGTASEAEMAWCSQRSPIATQRGSVTEFGARS